MSRRDMQGYLPNKPLQDGDNLADTKKVINQYRVIFEYLLRNEIDHKQSNVDSDTDWNTLDNWSLYGFSSLRGPNSPELDKMGNSLGVVLCTSAPVGERFQIAFTEYQIAFRSLNSEWRYLGQGVPANIDISKLIDQETLRKILDNYYPVSYINHLQDSFATLEQLRQAIHNRTTSIQNVQNDVKHDHNAIQQIARREAKLSDNTDLIIVAFNQAVDYINHNYAKNHKAIHKLAHQHLHDENKINNLENKINQLTKFVHKE